MPRLNTATNLPLGWGEWLGIACFYVVAVALVITAVLQTMVAVWFGAARPALLPFGTVLLTLAIAAFALRLCDAIQPLQARMGLVHGVGIIITALVLIHAQVFPGFGWDDWRWLASFQDIANLTAERPHAELGLILLSVIIWDLGSRITHNAGDYERRRGAFLGHFVVLVLTVIVAAWLAGGVRSLAPSLALILPLYTLAGLLMMAQVRLSEVRARMQRAARQDRRLLRVWRLTTAGLALGMVLIVAVVGAIFYGDTYYQALVTLVAAWNSVLAFLAPILTVLSLPLFWLIALFIRPRSSSSSTSTTPTSHPPAISTSSPPLAQSTVHLVYSGVLLVLLGLVALFVFLRTQRNMGLASTDSYDEVRETLPATRLVRPPRPAAIAPLAETPPPGSVRAVYRDFLRQGAQSALPRQTEETPAEYAARLQLQLVADPVPDAVAAMQGLTRAYEDERYGAIAPTPQRFALAQAALQRIKTALAQLANVIERSKR